MSDQALVPAFDHLAGSEGEVKGVSTFNGFKGGEVEVGVELLPIHQIALVENQDAVTVADSQAFRLPQQVG